MEWGGIQTDPVTGELGYGGVPAAEEEAAKSTYVDTFRAEDRANRARIQEQYSTKAEYDFQYQVRHEGAKGKYQAAMEAWYTASDDLRPDYFTDWELSLYSQTVRDRIIDELGYYRDDEGKWVPMEIQDEEYGMDENSFPGYGVGGGGGGGGYGGGGGRGGGGGGGGGYEYPIRGSSYRGYKTGGKTRRVSKQIFAGSIPRSHWRH
jgi:hypothetical protein